MTTSQKPTLLHNESVKDIFSLIDFIINHKQNIFDILKMLGVSVTLYEEENLLFGKDEYNTSYKSGSYLLLDNTLITKFDVSISNIKYYEYFLIINLKNKCYSIDDVRMKYELFFSGISGPLEEGGVAFKHISGDYTLTFGFYGKTKYCLEGVGIDKK